MSNISGYINYMNMMKSETLYMLFMSLKISATTQREKIKFIVKMNLI